MAVQSEVSIANLALQKLGDERIASLTEDSTVAREVNNCYEILRDREQRAHAWNFCKKRTILAPDATPPPFDYAFAFPLPADNLRLLPPNRLGLDWKIENHNGTKAILTNDGNTLEIEYVARIEDTAQFDPLFVEALASKMAWHMAEKLTQSNTKKAAALQEYITTMREARKINSFENIATETPQDSWDAARRVGGLRNDIRRLY